MQKLSKARIKVVSSVYSNTAAAVNNNTNTNGVKNQTNKGQMVQALNQFLYRNSTKMQNNIYQNEKKKKISMPYKFL